MSQQPSSDATAFPGLPSSGDPAFDAFLRDFLRQAVVDFASDRCSHCGKPRGTSATGTLCQRCSDRALIEIAAVAGVRAIASDEWSADDPTAEHPIWSAIARSLDRRRRGSSIEDLYPVLDELHLFETLTVVETEEGQFAFERVALPHPASVANRCWLIVWSERYASFLVSAFAGEQRENRLLAAIADITQRRDRAALQAQTEANLAANKVYYRL